MVAPVLALDTGGDTGGGGSIAPSSGSLNIPNPFGDVSTVSGLLFNIIGFLIVLSIPISMILVVYAGFLYITSAGNEDKIKTAQKTLTWALIGFAIVLIARGVPALIQEILSGK